MAINWNKGLRRLTLVLSILAGLSTGAIQYAQTKDLLETVMVTFLFIVSFWALYVSVYWVARPLILYIARGFRS